jgi:hypothetical protein
VVVPESVFGLNPGVLTITGIDENLLPYEITFDVFSGAIRVSKDGTTPLPLSSAVATTSLLLFTYLTNDHSLGVRVELQMSGGSGTVYKNEKFYGFAVLRGSY